MYRLSVPFLILTAICGCVQADNSFVLAESVGQHFINLGSSGKAHAQENSTTIPGIVLLGPKFAAKLDELKTKLNASCFTKALDGDAPAPIGENEATHHIYLVCNNSYTLGIRLKLNSKADKFHILGFWTP